MRVTVKVVAAGLVALLATAACGSSGNNEPGSQFSPGFAECDSKPNTCNSGPTKQGGTIVVAIEKKLPNWNTFDSDGKGCARAHVKRDFVGRDVAVLAQAAGVRVPASVELLFGETDEKHPFVVEEQMMKLSQTQADYNQIINLYRKHVDMLKTAIGRGV